MPRKVVVSDTGIVPIEEDGARFVTRLSSTRNANAQYISQIDSKSILAPPEIQVCF